MITDADFVVKFLLGIVGYDDCFGNKEVVWPSKDAAKRSIAGPLTATSQSEHDYGVSSFYQHHQHHVRSDACLVPSSVFLCHPAIVEQASIL